MPSIWTLVESVTDHLREDGCPLFIVLGSAVKKAIVGLGAGGGAAGGGGGGGGGAFLWQPAAMANISTAASVIDALHFVMILVVPPECFVLPVISLLGVYPHRLFIVPRLS